MEKIEKNKKGKLMKVRVMIIGCLISLLVLFCGYGAGAVKTKAKDETAAGTQSKIGVISVRKIFQACKRNEKYRLQAKAEQEKAISELQQLRAEIKAAEAQLETRKAGTKDYLDLAQELSQKKATLPLKQDYYEQQFSAKDKDWTEQLYKDILASVNKIAEEKTLDMVFEKDQPEFPVERADELMLTIRTNKILYTGSTCLDITDDVTTRIDANSPQ
jgi:Skp family chaperone for outer membrane proteins